MRHVDWAGIITTAAGTGVLDSSGDDGPASSACFLNPYAVAGDSAGNVYVSDTGAFVVRKISVFTTVVSTIGGKSGRTMLSASADHIHASSHACCVSLRNVAILRKRG